MKNRLGVWLALVLGIAIGSGLSVTTGVFADRDAAHEELPLEELRLFTDVLARIKQEYVEKVDDKTLLESAIRGMLNGLDPHSSYLDEEQFKELKIGTSGEFGGLGIEVGMENGFVKVIAPIDDTPAARAGIKAGDLIVRLNDTSVKGMSLSDAVQIMRGKKGTKIVLTVVREGKDKPFKVEITRDIIRVQSVKSRLLDPGFGYLRITNFQSNTARNLREAIKELEKTNDGKLRGTILDLRNNPGGILNGAVDVADAFLHSGLIVYTEGRDESGELRYSASQGDVLDGAALVVLVNEGSASASEIVAGALQDHERAIVLGTQTFGKGSVQTILPLRQNNAVKLTTALYYTPSGRSIQAEGIKPDIKLPMVEVSLPEGADLKPLKEKDLSGHLEILTGDGDTDANTEKADDAQGNSDSEDTDAAKPEQDKDQAARLIEKDYQLYQALNLLKGLAILSERH